MEATDEDVTSVLTEALTGYLKIIELEQKLHETSQPRQGKGVETHIDVARSQYFQSRSLVTATCLRFAGRLASHVRKWASGAEEVETKARMEALIDLYPPSVDRYISSAEEDDEPYVNPMTGQIIYPVTSRSAGPSNWYGSDSEKNFVYPNKVDTKLLTPSKKGKEREGSRPITHDEDLIDLSTPDLGGGSDPVQTPNLMDLLDDETATLYVTTERDNAPLCLDHFSDQYRSPSPESLDFHTPQASTPTTQPLNSPPHISNANPLSFQEDLDEALKVHSEWADSLFQNKHDIDFPNDTTSARQFDFDFLTAQRLQAEFDNEFHQQETYARQIQQAEHELTADLDHDLAEAARLTSQWEAQDEITQKEVAYWQEKWKIEDQQMEAQAEFAKEILRSDEQKEESIRHDMAVAMAAQTQWEAEAQELEQKARQAAEEAQRREEEERRRFAEEMAERERRAKVERERIAREEAEREEERKRKEKMAECVVCGEEGERTEMCILGCTHGYCRGCVVEAVKSATKSRTAFKCCGKPGPTNLTTRFLPAALQTTYSALLLERSTPNPKYCSNRNCSLFIPPTSITGPLAICPSCGTRSCSSCSQAEHAGVCTQDVAGQKVLALAGKKGWKSCPNCKAVLERTEGCLHMTCRCGAEWCYSCLGNWRNCRSTCSRT